MAEGVMPRERHSNGQAPGTQTTSPPSRLDVLQKAIFAPFSHKKRDSTRILSDLAPVIMTPRIIHSASTYSVRSQHGIQSSSLTKSKMDFATLGRGSLRLSNSMGLGQRRVTSRDLQIVEATEELLDTEVPEPDGVASNVSLLRGFNATIPSAEKGRLKRRQLRNVETPPLGLKRLGMSARGIIMDDEERQSVVSEEDVVIVSTENTSKRKRRGRESLSALKTLGEDELMRQSGEIQWDKENLHVKRNLVRNEISEITRKIEALDSIRVKLEQDLLKLQEDELELDDELLGVRERLEFEQQQESQRKLKASVQGLHLPQSSRRRKGPAFLPSEHDELPPGVAFMTLDSHTTPITALDFSEPYGTLVSSSEEDAQPRVWDLLSGIELGRLRGHRGTVKCLQVEDHVCLTGGEDGNVRLWDLRRVDDDPWGAVINLPDVAEEDEANEGDSRQSDRLSGIRDGDDISGSETDGPCARILEGHSKAVTALFFEDECLVTGASDKTLRQWDLTTGQCVMTMDILWAISHPPQSVLGETGSNLYRSPASQSGVPTPLHEDGSWEMHEDFVGGVQFWGYGLVSGSADGVVRMWDMRTGQAHRTLTGHTAPISCLQFDEIHIASGSLDKTIHIWDLRTGAILETIQFHHPVSSLQFDTRKVVVAAGDNGIKIYNRTTRQQSSLLTNGHTQSVQSVRYMDRYLVSGGRDSMLKIWSL